MNAGVEGAKGCGGIATHVERRSRDPIAVRLIDKTASAFTSQSIKALQVFPHVFRYILTLDNVKENACFKTVEKKVGFAEAVRKINHRLESASDIELLTKSSTQPKVMRLQFEFTV